MKKKNIAKKRILVFLFVVLFLVLYIYIYVIPNISDKFKDTYVLQYGTISNGEYVDYLVVRNEYVSYSANSGNVDRLVDSGALIKKGIEVVKVGNTAYKNTNRGVVSYFYDGYENVYTLENIKGLKATVIDDINNALIDSEGKKSDLVKECSSDSVSFDDPLFKIVDNQEWYLVVWLPKSIASNMSVNSSIKIKFDEDHIIKMKVYSLFEQGSETEVILSSTGYYEEFDKIRIGKTTVITNEITGLLLETSSIVTVNDTVGVYVINNNNKTVFMPINILATFGDVTVVSRNYFYDKNGDYTYTVKIYDTILRK